MNEERSWWRCPHGCQSYEGAERKIMSSSFQRVWGWKMTAAIKGIGYKLGIFHLSLWSILLHPTQCHGNGNLWIKSTGFLAFWFWLGLAEEDCQQIWGREAVFLDCRCLLFNVAFSTHLSPFGSQDSCSLFLQARGGNSSVTSPELLHYPCTFPTSSTPL